MADTTPLTKKNPQALLPKGKTPQTRGREKRRQALAWLLRWHYATNEAVCDAISIKDSGYLAKLAKHGVVQSVSVPTLATRTVYVLTPSGISEAIADEVEPTPYPRDPARFNHKLVRHHLATQRTVAGLFGLQSAIPERLMTLTGKAAEKRPDALVLTDRTAPHWAALEVELTPKYERELDQTLWRHVEALNRGDYHFVIYTSHSQALLARYKAHLGKPIRQWEKDATAQKWKAVKSMPMPLHLQERFIFVTNPALIERL